MDAKGGSCVIWPATVVTSIPYMGSCGFTGVVSTERGLVPAGTSSS